MARLLALLACALASTSALSISAMPAVQSVARPQCLGLQLQPVVE